MDAAEDQVPGDADAGTRVEATVDPVGGRQFGNYILKRRLARGGMGEVYLARLVGELGFEKQLVIKTILPELAEKPRFIEMFAAEAKTAVALTHGNIVPAYELGRASDTFYIAMGYVDGPSVAQLLEAAQAAGDPPDLSVALHVIRGVLTGLAYAHREEPGRPAVVHRDITPRNVLIDRSGQVRIVDFGISAPARREVGIRAGSVGYVSPEQARGEAADPRADVFSVGCLLYELCTHTRAFPKEDVWVPPELEDLPESVREPLRRAMKVDPNARFRDASEMKEALRAAFTEFASTFDDAALANTLGDMFPRGWDRVCGEDSNDQGRAVLAGPSETYATRLTAVTGIEGGLALDRVLAPDSPDPTDPAYTPTEPAVAANRSGARSAEPYAVGRRGRVSTVALLLGALAIGLAAFWIGRTNLGSDDDAASKPTLPPIVAQAGATQDPPAAAQTPPPPAPLPFEPAPPKPVLMPVQHELTVEPADAQIEVDGEPLASGPPYVIALPDEEPLQVRIWAKGHVPKTLTLSRASLDDPARPSVVRLVPKPLPKPRDPGELRVLAPSVDWAEVLVDGKKVGNTPTRRISLPSGRHKVEVRCVPDACTPGRTLYRQSITVEPGRVTRIDAGA